MWGYSQPAVAMAIRLLTRVLYCLIGQQLQEVTIPEQEIVWGCSFMLSTELNQLKHQQEQIKANKCFFLCLKVTRPTLYFKLCVWHCQKQFQKVLTERNPSFNPRKKCFSFGPINEEELDLQWELMLLHHNILSPRTSAYWPQNPSLPRRVVSPHTGAGRLCFRGVFKVRVFGPNIAVTSPLMWVWYISGFKLKLAFKALPHTLECLPNQCTHTHTLRFSTEDVGEG